MVGFLGVISLLISAAPSQAAPKLCSNTYGGDLVYAKHLGCHRAHQVVRAWARAYKREGTPNVDALAFRCNGRVDSVEGLVISCHRHRKRVTFYANVP